ncbi:glycosyltransferase family 4 protein [Nguyenibacter sp. L1]|nr:glycosyltransferase family 4 protein [Nguyenibacter sp. L1]WRH88589.1 glycosyltransferase family 4 protein [Nguyenibacter sp. L1]
MAVPRVMTVLPPRERFAPGCSGVIGLLVHRLAGAGDLVVGAAVDDPFADVAFRAVPRAWLPISGALRGGALGGAGRYAAGVARLVREIGPDMVEIHNRPDIAWALARRFPRLRMVLFLHNDPPAMRGARKPGQRAAIARRMRVVAVSDWVRGRFLDGVSEDVPGGAGLAGRVEVAANCIDLASLPAPLPPEARERVILFAGRVVADKGADSFVAACGMVLPELPGWRAVMIGADRFGADSPETPFLAALRPAARAAGVELAGYLPHRRVAEAMARAAILVVPSRWPEPFGVVALDGMAGGAALIVAPRGGLPDVVGEAALQAEPDPPAMLAAAIRRLARSPEERAEFSARGLARVQAFDRPAARMRLEALRRRVLEEAVPSG